MNVSAAATPRRRHRVAAAVLAAALLLIAGAAAWYFLGAPSAPVLDLSNAEPEVKAAVEAARGIVRWSPRSGEAWGRLGVVLFAHGYVAEAVACFARAEELDSGEPRWPYLRGTLLLRQQPAEALLCWERAANHCGPTIDAPRLRLAEALLEQGRFDEAEAHLLRVVARDAAQPRAALGLGRLACVREDWSAALPHLKLASDHPATRKAARALLAEAHRRLGDAAAADQALRRVAELPPDAAWPDPFLDEVWAAAVGKQVALDRVTRLGREGRQDEARAAAQQLEERYPDLYWLVEGRVRLEHGDARGAEEALRKAVELAPDLLDARFHLADALARQNKDPEAAECYRKVTEREPAYERAYVGLGECLKRMGQRGEAIAAYQAAVSYAPLRADLRRQLGELLSEEGRRAQALEQLRHAVRLDPGDRKAAELMERLLKDEAEAR
jgi:tetratricopeptide (TPR) repeat protein